MKPDQETSLSQEDGAGGPKGKGRRQQRGERGGNKHRPSKLKHFFGVPNSQPGEDHIPFEQRTDEGRRQYFANHLNRRLKVVKTVEDMQKMIDSLETMDTWKGFQGPLQDDIPESPMRFSEEGLQRALCAARVVAQSAEAETQTEARMDVCDFGSQVGSRLPSDPVGAAAAPPGAAPAGGPPLFGDH